MSVPSPPVASGSTKGVMAVSVKCCCADTEALPKSGILSRVVKLAVSSSVVQALSE